MMPGLFSICAATHRIMLAKELDQPYSIDGHDEEEDMREPAWIRLGPRLQTRRRSETDKGMASSNPRGINDCPCFPDSEWKAGPGPGCLAGGSTGVGFTPYLLELELGLHPGVRIGIQSSEEQRSNIGGIHFRDLWAATLAGSAGDDLLLLFGLGMSSCGHDAMVGHPGGG